MCQSLLTRCFKWVEDVQSLEYTTAEHLADSSEGYILKMDPEHKVHNAYPLVLERMVVQKGRISEYQADLICERGVPKEIEELVPNSVAKKALCSITATSSSTCP